MSFLLNMFNIVSRIYPGFAHYLTVKAFNPYSWYQWLYALKFFNPPRDIDNILLGGFVRPGSLSPGSLSPVATSNSNMDPVAPEAVGAARDIDPGSIVSGRDPMILEPPYERVVAHMRRLGLGDDVLRTPFARYVFGKPHHRELIEQRRAYVIVWV
jgi:hypothetical protein